MTKLAQHRNPRNTLTYREALTLIVSEIESQEYDLRNIPLSMVLACVHDLMIEDVRS